MSDSDPRTEELSPIPQTRHAFDWLASFGNAAIEDSVTRMAKGVREIAPDCMALSLTLNRGELTFTVMADRPGIALLDAMQYLDGGPCVHSTENHEVVTTVGAAMNEERWHLFAAGQAMMGVSSTLSMPIVRDGQMIGGVNLYGSTTDAFEGVHEDLASACGAWAEGAITNADLSFTSRLRAAATPERLQQRADVSTATGFVAAYHDIDLHEAGARIHEAAARADVTEADFSRFLLDAHNRRHSS